jgi:hypothetical protein
MPVRKFRSVEEMERPLWRTPGDPALYRAMARLWDFGRRSRPRRFVPGVYRSRSIEGLEARTTLTKPEPP